MLVVFHVNLVVILQINPMVNRGQVVVADPVLASFHQTYSHHLFYIVISSCCDSLVVA
jgi:hypothetical protein